MRREELESMSTAELVDLRSEIEVLLAHRNLKGKSNREIFQGPR